MFAIVKENFFKIKEDIKGRIFNQNTNENYLRLANIINWNYEYTVT